MSPSPATSPSLLAGEVPNDECSTIPTISGRGGLWDAASSFLGLGTNALSYQEASTHTEHFACQGTAATGTRCAQTSICSRFFNAPACSRVEDVPLPRGVYGEPPAAEQTSKLKPTAPTLPSPTSTVLIHHTSAEQTGPVLALHVWDRPVRCPAKDQGAICAMTFLVYTLITWDS